jgi:hypothetical protein
MWQLLIPALTQVLDKILPDPQAAADAKLKVLELAQKGDETLLGFAERMSTSQNEVNKAEASSGNAYAASWRPTIGYVIAFALAFHYILNPLLLWAAVSFHANITPPNIALDDHIWELIMGMLGMAGWRTLDKIKGRS